MSSWTTGTMPAVVALCKMEIVSMKSGKAPRNLPTRSRAELSPSSFYTLVQWFRFGAQHKVLKNTVKDKVDNDLSVPIKDDFLKVLKVCIVDQRAQVRSRWWRDCT